MRKNKLSKEKIIPFLVGCLFMLIIVVIIFHNILFFEIYYKKISNMYDGTIDKTRMQQEIISGITDGLGDKHSTYLPPKKATDLKNQLSSSASGAGISYNVDGDGVYITNVAIDSPAELEEIYPGDQIISINDTTVSSKNVSDVATLIKDNVENKIKIYRPSTNESLTATLTPQEYVNLTVTSLILPDNSQVVGYIEIENFADQTDEEFADALKNLEDKKIDKLIIDLRGDGGGELASAAAICNQLIVSDKPFLTIKSGDKVVKEYTSELTKEKDYPIVTLVDGDTASASEILVAALSELGNSTIVGNTTYGKGSVQTYFKMPFIGGGTKITTEHWYTPNDENIDGIGIEPNIKVDEKKAPITFDVKQLVLKEKLELNSKDENVVLVNYYLSLLGYDTDKYSYVYNDKTVQAVSEFQKKNGFDVTGTLDSKVAYELYKEALIAQIYPNNDVYIKKAMEV